MWGVCSPEKYGSPKTSKFWCNFAIPSTQPGQPSGWALPCILDRLPGSDTSPHVFVMFRSFFHCLISEVSGPIVTKLSHMLGGDCNLWNCVRNPETPFPEKFVGPKTPKFWCDVGQLQDLTVNISWLEQNIVVRKTSDPLTKAFLSPVLRAGFCLYSFIMDPCLLSLHHFFNSVSVFVIQLSFHFHIMLFFQFYHVATSTSSEKPATIRWHFYSEIQHLSPLQPVSFRWIRNPPSNNPVFLTRCWLNTLIRKVSKLDTNIIIIIIIIIIIMIIRFVKRCTQSYRGAGHSCCTNQFTNFIFIIM